MMMAMNRVPCSVRVRHSTPHHRRRLGPTQRVDPFIRRTRVPRAATASPPGFTEPPQQQQQGEEEKDRDDESIAIGGFNNSNSADLGYTREDWRGGECVGGRQARWMSALVW